MVGTPVTLINIVLLLSDACQNALMFKFCNAPRYALLHCPELCYQAHNHTCNNSMLISIFPKQYHSFSSF